jgi:hypothetical protein
MPPMELEPSSLSMCSRLKYRIYSIHVAVEGLWAQLDDGKRVCTSFNTTFPTALVRGEGGIPLIEATSGGK